MVRPGNVQIKSPVRKRVAAFVEHPYFIGFITALMLINAVTLGLETDASFSSSYGAFLQVVSVNQWLGDQTHIAASFAGDTIVSVAHDRVEISPGEQIHFAIEAADLHVFDRQSGETLGGRA